MKQNHFSLILLIALVLNCKNNKAIDLDSQTKQVVQTPDKLISTKIKSHFFEASGDDWDLIISESDISFTSQRKGFEVFNAPTTEPILAQDANVKQYRSVPELGTIIVYINYEECIKSEETSWDYKVKVEIKRGIDNEFSTFEGCGNYILDYRLHDIWVLKTIYDDEVLPDYFREELPRIEINSAKKSFFGFAGCNRMNGQIFSENELIRFHNIITTKMLCAPPNKENEFLKALQSSTGYKIEKNRLFLFNPDRSTLSFIKAN